MTANITLKAEDLIDALGAAKVTGKEEGIMELYGDFWIMKTAGPSAVLMHAIKVPEEAMDKYEPGDEDTIPLSFIDVESFVVDSSSPLSLEFPTAGGRGLDLWQKDDHITLATPLPQEIYDTIPDMPDVEYDVVFEAPEDLLTGFASRIEDFQSEHFMLISGREEGLYLYAAGDNFKLDRMMDWEDIDTQKTLSGGKEFDVIQSTSFMKDLKVRGDTVRYHVGGSIPTKIVMEFDNGVKESYFQAPRIAEDMETGITELPESARRV